MPILRLQGNKERVKGIYYEVDSDSKPIGVGGMGTVYKGRQVDEQTGVTREVAIKFLFDDLNPKTVEKARREANIQLRNSNLVEMLGFIETEERAILGHSHKRYHVVSELLHGVSLSDVMKGKTTDFEGYEVAYAAEKQRQYENNPLEFARDVVHEVLLGLIALHNAGYIHRDIDPSNIMITDDGHIKLIDFGIAKQMSALTQTDASHTQEGTLIGKAEYAPPELVEGRIKEQDQRSDIYAMGMLLYTCIVGHPPFPVGQPYGYDLGDVLNKQMHDSVPVKLIRNKDMRAIIRKATQKKRERRFQSTAEMMVALEKLPQPVRPEAFPYEWKKPVALGTAIVALAGLLLGVWPLVTNTGPVVVVPEQASQPAVALTPLQEAEQMLKNDHTATIGLQRLDSLSNAGDGEAKFLLSRLYFHPTDKAYVPADIEQMKKHVNVSDNRKAHQLLEEAVNNNHCTNFYAYFEYASDYRYGEFRCAEYKDLRSNESIEKAKKYFEMALEGAKESYAREPNDFANTIRKEAKDELVNTVKYMAKKNVGKMTEKERDKYLNWLDEQ